MNGKLPCLVVELMRARIGGIIIVCFVGIYADFDRFDDCFDKIFNNYRLNSFDNGIGSLGWLPRCSRCL